MYKTITVLTDGIHTANIPVMGDTTVDEIQQSSIVHLRTQGKDPTNYKAHLNLSSRDKILHDLSQNHPSTLILFNSLQDPRLYLHQINMFERLPPNVVRQIAQDMPYQQIVNLCLTSTRLNEIICQYDLFWLNQIQKDFPYLTMEEITKYKGDRKWRDYYVELISTRKNPYSYSKRPDRLKILIRQEHFNQSDSYKSVFNVATAQGYLDILRDVFENLKSRGIKFDVRSLLLDAIYKNQTDVSKFLIDMGIDQSNGANLQDILEKVISHGNLELVKFLVEKGIDIHYEDDAPVRYASEDGYVDIVKYLVEQGADIHALDDFALRFASERGHLDVVEYLVGQGANVNSDNDFALRVASQNGYLKIAKILVENGADVNVGFQVSSEYGGLEMVKYMVSKGADVHANNDSALRNAIKYGHDDVADYLRSLP